MGDVSEACTDTELLIRKIHDPFAGDLRAAIDVVQLHCESFLRKGLSAEQSTSMEDCALLYLLIRYFNRRHAFEIGTNVGTTAVCMNEAVRKTGGVMTTCDPVNYGALSPWSGIRLIHARSNVALAILKSEGHKVDFVFLDWVPDEESLRLANEVFTEDTILAVHNYSSSDPKGEVIVHAIDQSYSRASAGRWFFPDVAPIELSTGMRVNGCTAFFIPFNLLAVTAQTASADAAEGSVSGASAPINASHLDR